MTTHDHAFPSGRLRYALEHERRLRVAVVGCGGQAYRNILPSLAYIPVDLMVTCDVDSERAKAYAQRFGAPRWASSFDEVLGSSDLDAVLLAVGYDADGLPLYPRMATSALEAGLHVWMEKPPAARSGEIEALAQVRDRTGRSVSVGYMKMFGAAISKVCKLMKRDDFGRPTTLYLRDSEKVPAANQRTSLTAMHHLLDHLSHPASVLQRVVGPPQRVVITEAFNGAGMLSMHFADGAIGVLHLAWGQSDTSPMERLEVVGEGANLIVDGNLSVTYYPRGHRGTETEYGRNADFTTSDEQAPLHWRMEAYSGQPYNNHLFYQGYVPELNYFARCVLDREPITIAGLEDAWYITRLFEACQRNTEEVYEVGTCPFQPR